MTTTKDSLTPTFSWETALFLAHACQLAYKEAADIALTVKDEWKFDEVATFDVDNQQGFVCSDAERVLIIFRGTDSFPDWVTNLDLPPVDQPYGKVHRGFQGAWASLEYDVTSALERFDRERTKQLYVAGHSLGGAIANVAAMELPKTRAIQGLYTFGQPRTGADEFVKNCNTQFDGVYHRIVNDDDIVAMIPPGYSHCGTLYWFEPNGSLKPSGARTPVVSTKEYQDFKSRVEAIKTKVKAKLPPGPEQRREEVQEMRENMPNVDDHMMDNYVACLESQVTGIPVPLSEKDTPSKLDTKAKPGAPTAEKPKGASATAGKILAVVVILAAIAAAVYYFVLK